MFFLVILTVYKYTYIIDWFILSKAWSFANEKDLTHNFISF